LEVALRFDHRPASITLAVAAGKIITLVAVTVRQINHLAGDFWLIRAGTAKSFLKEKK